ncbi:hypothetical protein ACFE04_023396 [Oxalis oulophora]
MDTYKTWEEEKIAHKSARDRLNYLEYMSKKLMGTRDDLKFSILPTKTVGMRSRRGRPPLKRMVASRSTWIDKNWSGEGDFIFQDDVILEGGVMCFIWKFLCTFLYLDVARVNGFIHVVGVNDVFNHVMK